MGREEQGCVGDWKTGAGGALKRWIEEREGRKKNESAEGVQGTLRAVILERHFPRGPAVNWKKTLLVNSSFVCMSLRSTGENVLLNIHFGKGFKAFRAEGSPRQVTLSLPGKWCVKQAWCWKWLYPRRRWLSGANFTHCGALSIP